MDEERMRLGRPDGKNQGRIARSQRNKIKCFGMS